MPRPPRFTYPHAVHHVTLRCNNREFLFDPASFELFLSLLQETRRRFPLSLFHYCLMTNHVHLFLQVGLADTLSLRGRCLAPWGDARNYRCVTYGCPCHFDRRGRPEDITTGWVNG